MASLTDFIAWLDTHTNLERGGSLRQSGHAMSLDAIEALCAAQGHPERSAKVVHVAGSKGKGSTAKMIACILSSAGLKTGLYLSPHVSDFRERAGTAEGPFSDDIYGEASSLVMAAEAQVRAQGITASWFELVTLFSFICFRIARTDINVIEVGIGGRLDATNVVLPAVTCIMPVEKEHTEWLGNTIAEIAMEKAGIIKRGVPVVVAAGNNAEALKVIRDKAKELDAQVIETECIGVSCAIKRCPAEKAGALPPVSMDVSFTCEPYGTINACMALAGTQMAQNAVVAAIAAKKACSAVTKEDVEKGLSIASLPARFECFDYNGASVIIDGAHTVSSIRRMLSTLDALHEGEASLLFGCASDKDVEDMARLIAKHKWQSVTLTVPGALGRADLSRTEKAFKAAGIAARVIGGCDAAIKSALEDASSGGRHGTLVAAGSFYLASAIRFVTNGGFYE